MAPQNGLILCITSREAHRRLALYYYYSFDSGHLTVPLHMALQQLRFADSALMTLLLARFSVLSWPHANETIRGIYSTIASRLAVTAQFCGISLKLASRSPVAEQRTE